MTERFFTLTEDGARLALRVTPNAARSAIEGVETRPGAGAQLRLRVHAAPEKGKANRAALALLAEALGAPASSFCVMAGETARDKIVLWRGDPAQCAAALSAWLEAFPCPQD